MGLRALYICYLTLEDPLVHTQVVAYLEGLAERGHTIHLLTFEPELTPGREQELEAAMRERGIHWHALRYHKRPSLPATVYDTLAGALVAVRLVRRHRLDAIHARNHVPAAMALIARRLTGARLIFDLRGLMAEEYVDAGIWRRGGVPYRLTNWIQDLALRRAAAIVMLTAAVREHLAPSLPAATPVAVIPCCVDVERISRHAGEGAAARAELGLGRGPVMVYVGKFTGWYMDAELVDFVRAARERAPGLVLLVVTQADPAPIVAELAAGGVPTGAYRITSATPEKIGRLLAAADFGISFVRPCLSKISSSPTKVGEYLAAGLPVVSTAIGDLRALLADTGAGVLVDEFDARSYDRAAERVLALAGALDAGERCRALAQAELSLDTVGLPRYDALYRGLAADA